MPIHSCLQSTLMRRSESPGNTQHARCPREKCVALRPESGASTASSVSGGGPEGPPSARERPAGAPARPKTEPEPSWHRNSSFIRARRMSELKSMFFRVDGSGWKLKSAQHRRREAPRKEANKNSKLRTREEAILNTTEEACNSPS